MEEYKIVVMVMLTIAVVVIQLWVHKKIREMSRVYPDFCRGFIESIFPPLTIISLRKKRDSTDKKLGTTK